MKTFMEILIEKVEGPKKNTFTQEYDTSPRHMSYIIGLQKNSSPQKSSARAWNYYKPTPRPAHSLNKEQMQAFDFFNKLNVNLKDNFNYLELKKAFRQLAKRFHPDLSKTSATTEAFINIKNQYEILTQIFT